MEQLSLTRKIIITVLFWILYWYLTLHYHYVSTITVSIITMKWAKTIHFIWQMSCQQWTVLCEPHWPFYEFVLLTVDVWFSQEQLSQSTLLHHKTHVYYRHFKVRIFFMFSWLLWQFQFSLLQNPPRSVNEGRILLEN